MEITHIIQGYYDMELVSPFLALCEGNPPVTGGFPLRETNAGPLYNVSAFWAGWVENWSGQVEFRIELIRDICFCASAPKV